MFTWLNKQGVQSSDGFVLQSMHRFYYHYIEGDKRLKVYVEPFTDKTNHYSETIYTDSSYFEWLPPYDNDVIDANEKKKILQNISEALAFMGIDHRFVART